MIKPASYWALHKTADAETLGRIGLALAGREGELSPPLAYAEKLLVDVIRQDSEWMDENIAKQKQRVAEAVKAHRERKRAAANAEAEKLEKAKQPTPPSPVEMKEPEAVAEEETQKQTPIIDERYIFPERDCQKLYARQLNVPIEYIDIFNKKIRELGFQYISRSGATVNINRSNWKSVLRKFYAQDLKKDKTTPAPQSLQQDGYKPEIEMA